MIYLDNAATTWPKPAAVYAAVDACLRELPGSAGRGGHAGAREAARILFAVREEVAALFGAEDSTRLVFTANATQALNTALFGLRLQPGEVVVTSSWEHNAVARPLHALARQGITVRRVPPAAAGPLDLAALEEALRGARLLVLAHASNVTGAVLPLREAARLAAQRGVTVLVDAAQTAGVEEIDVSWGLQLVAFAGHKGLYGPQGTGGLYVAPELSLEPLCYGGTGSLSEREEQPLFFPDRLESGTVNTPGLAGLLAGVRFVRRTGLAALRAREETLLQRLRGGLAAIPGVRLWGEYPPPSPRTAVLSFTVQGLDSAAAALWLEQQAGVICRAGLHCAPWAHRTLGTLESGTIRFSPGWFNTLAEMDAAVEAVRTLAQEEGVS